jgi:hypothetical protein
LEREVVTMPTLLIPMDQGTFTLRECLMALLILIPVRAHSILPVATIMFFKNLITMEILSGLIP